MKLQSILEERADEENLLGQYIPNGSNLTQITEDSHKKNWMGNFDCKEMRLKSLKWGPGAVYGNFECSDNKLTSLEGAPSAVKGIFNCSHNKIESLEDGPTTVDGMYSCAFNQIHSLKGAPASVRAFDCDSNLLTSLEGVPKVAERFLSISANSLQSLEGIHELVHETLKIFAQENPIKSHVLGLMLIKNLGSVSLDNKEVTAIINEHLPNTEGKKGVIKCQSALIDAGFEEFAQL